MAPNFDRKYRLVLNREGQTTIYTERHIRFNIQKFAGGENNVGLIDVFNLPERERNRMARPVPNVETVIVEPRISVFLYVGYGASDRVSLISRGVARQAFSVRDGVNWRTHFETYSTLEQDVNTQLTKSWRSTPAQLILIDLFDSWKIGKVRITNEAQDRLNVIITDYVVNKHIKTAIRNLLDIFQLTFTVDDDGPIVVVSGNAFDAGELEETLPLISEATGMIGSPQITLTGANVRAQLSSNISGLYPLRSFVLESLTTRATFERFSINAGAPENKFRQRFTVTEMDIMGDSREGDWAAAITGVYPNFAHQGLDIPAQPRAVVQ